MLPPVLTDEAASEMVPQKRAALYDEAQRILAEDVGGVFLYYKKIASLRKPWLKGYKEDKAGQHPFWGNNTGYMNLYIGNNAR